MSVTSCRNVDYAGKKGLSVKELFCIILTKLQKNNKNKIYLKE